MIHDTPRAPPLGGAIGATGPTGAIGAAPGATAPPARLLESAVMSPAQAQALLRMVEGAPAVHRRFQFYVWVQTHVQVLVPHVLAVCGVYSRQRRGVLFDAFPSVALPPALLERLSGHDSPLMAGFARAWIEAGGRPCVMVAGQAQHEAVPELDELAGAGLRHAVVHGVSRPERPHEIESLFLFAAPEPRAPANAAQVTEALLPQLHVTYTHVQVVERELAAGASRGGAAVERRRIPITTREAQILHWVREGKSNPEIGELLGISALTVKNHVQKILRKLGAANRAQAVAKAMALNL